MTSVAIPSLTGPINDPTAGGVQIAVYTASALRRHAIQMARGETVLMAQAALMLSASLVVMLIYAFDGFAAHQSWNKPRLVAGESG